MSAYIVIKKEKVECDEGITIEGAMLSAGKHPDAFLFLLDGRPLPMTTVLTKGMIIEALRVASGG
ncbi:MAG: hypothetical protein LBV13_03070 [Methanomassiliicoccaceae archaeon]|nr:hypothetical protein [Methanomassiliicoccaceae archaeon]